MKKLVLMAKLLGAVAKNPIPAATQTAKRRSKVFVFIVAIEEPFWDVRQCFLTSTMNFLHSAAWPEQLLQKVVARHSRSQKTRTTGDIMQGNLFAKRVLHRVKRFSAFDRAYQGENF